MFDSHPSSRCRPSCCSRVARASEASLQRRTTSIAQPRPPHSRGRTILSRAERKQMNRPRAIQWPAQCRNGVIGSSIGRSRRQSFSIRRSSHPASRCSTTTTTAISMCMSSRDRCSEPGSHSPTRCCQPPARSLPLRGRLFRNDLHLRDDGIRVLHFTDVTAQSGIDARKYGLGAATGDIDNDGCVDLLLTNFGTNQLFHNNCNGTFTDISKQSGIEDKPGVAVAAAFLDYDRDHLKPPISRGESVGPETSPL